MGLCNGNCHERSVEGVPAGEDNVLVVPGTADEEALASLGGALDEDFDLLPYPGLVVFEGDPVLQCDEPLESGQSGFTGELVLHRGCGRTRPG